jgi:hypothetical protein
VVPAYRRLGDPRFGADQLPADVHVHATARLPTPSQILMRGSIRGTTSASTAPTPARTQGAPLRTAGNLARSALMWLNTPDEFVGWLPFALWRSWRLAHRHDVRAIVASGPPFTTVVAGAALHSLTGLPLIADFRDAWAQDPSDPFGTIGGMFRAPYGPPRVAALQALEQRCLERSEKVLFTSQYTRDRYVEAYPFLADRSVLVWNGVEEADFTAPRRDLGAFTFVYVGSLYDYQWPQVELFLRAFRIASAQSVDIAASRLLFAGHRGADLGRRLAGALAAEGLSSQAKVLDVVHHDEAVAIMKGSGLLLLFAGDSRFTRLSKVSDCAAVARPMLALAPDDSETARHTRLLGQRVYSGQSAEALADLLRDIAATQPIRSEAAFPFPFPHELHWRRAVQQVAEQLDDIDARGAKMTKR